MLIIASDTAIIEMAYNLGLRVHISVQANVCNSAAVKFYAKYADVMILARELTLHQIKTITDIINKENITGPSGEKVRIEVIYTRSPLCFSFRQMLYESRCFQCFC